MSSVFGQKIGRYILLEKLGEGGMAIVYNAYDTHLEINVALKIILPSQRHKVAFIQRFLSEAKSLAQLSHPNIVKILDYGEWDGLPYIVMEYVSGGTLRDQMNMVMTWEEAATVLAPIARALEYVHKQKIVHRDVKPANILIDETGMPKLSDFGIVKIIEEKETQEMTAVGVGVGTPEYMSPEQGLGQEVDYRADIYALGVIFYELITGKKLYSADTPMGVIIKHVTESVPLPSKSISELPSEIDDVVLTALAKKPEQRYASMSEFAKVLEHLSHGKHNAKQIVSKNSNHKPLKRFVWSGIGTILVLFLIVISLLQLGVLKNFIPSFVLREFSTTVTSIIVDTPTMEIMLTTESSPTDTVTTMPSMTTSITMTLTPSPQKITEEPQVVYPVLMNTKIPAAKETISSSSSTKKIIEIARLGIGNSNEVAWSPDGKTIALATSAGLYIFDGSTYKQQNFINTDGWTSCIAFSPDGDFILSGTAEGNLVNWSLKKAGDRQEFPIPTGKTITSVAYAPSGRYIAAGTGDGIIFVFDIITGQKIGTMDQQYAVTGLSFSIDNRYLSSGDTDTDHGKLNIWDLSSQKLYASQNDHSNDVTDVVYSKDGKWIVTGCMDWRLRLWEASTGRLMHTFLTQKAPITSIAISPDGEIVAGGLSNGEIMFWSISDYSMLRDFKAHPDEVKSLSFSPDGKYLASSSWDQALMIWNTDGDNLYQFLMNIDDITQILFSPTNQYIVTSSIDETVRVWDLDSLSPLYIINGHIARGSAFSPDGQYLAVASEATPKWNTNGLIAIWDLRNGGSVAQVSGYSRGWNVSFSPDSNLLVSGTTRASFIWDTST